MTHKVVVFSLFETDVRFINWIVAGVKIPQKARHYRREIVTSSLDKNCVHFRGAEVVILCKSSTFIKNP